MFLDKFEHRAGLDAKFVVKDSLSFDFTLNPDFSQVESDDPQVTVNQRFAVFFPEKRPFFIENAGFFATPIDLFFSRQIAQPQFGSRMTGKLGNGRWARWPLTTGGRARDLQAARTIRERWTAWCASHASLATSLTSAVFFQAVILPTPATALPRSMRG